MHFNRGLLIIFLIILMSISVSGQSTGFENCCCFPSPAEPSGRLYDDPTRAEQVCNSFSSSESKLLYAVDQAQCQNYCTKIREDTLNDCSDTALLCGEAATAECLCGSRVAQSSEWCCSTDDLNQVYSQQTDCPTDGTNYCTTEAVTTIEIDVSGYISQDNSPVEAFLNVLGANILQTNPRSNPGDGSYAITIKIPESYASDVITITATNANDADCSGSEIFDKNNPPLSLDFELQCSTGQECTAEGGLCCPEGKICAGGLYTNSYSCEDTTGGVTQNCFVGCAGGCIDPVISPPVCELDECDYANDRVCLTEDNDNDGQPDRDSDNELIRSYQQPSNYCELCSDDPDCGENICVPDGCNGVCPLNCGQTDDPDCGIVCQTEANLYCDSDRRDSNGDLDPGWTNVDYCSYCQFEDNTDCGGVICGNAGYTTDRDTAIAQAEDTEECDDGKACSNGNGCTQHSDCQGIGDEACVPRSGDGCDASCNLEEPRVQEDRCGDGAVTSEEQCDNSADAIYQNLCGAGTCREDCTCSLSCDTSVPGDITMLTPILTKHAHEVIINFQFPSKNYCQDYFTKLTLYRCEGSSCQTRQSIVYEKADTTTSRLDPADIQTQGIKDDLTNPNPIRPETDYGYQVVLEFIDPITGLPDSVESEWAHIKTSQARCMRAPAKDEFCGTQGDAHATDEDTIYSCVAEDPKNDWGGGLYDRYIISDKVRICSPGFCAFGTGGESDYCANPGDTCNNCNSLFGMLSDWVLNANLPWEVDNEQDGDGNIIASFTCDDLVNAERPSCYQDKTALSAKYVSDCADVKSCSDYNSESVCGADPCNRIDEECVWDEFPNGQSSFDVGICRSTASESACSSCEEGSNKGIWPCSENVCQALSTDDNPCFFSEGDCVGEGGATCTIYKDETNCIGPHGTNPRQNFDLSNDLAETRSSDYFELGKCKWDGSNCYRDADDNQDSSINQNDKRDCDVNDKLCNSDFTSPTTTIPFDNEDNLIVGKTFQIPVTITDNVYETTNLETHYCYENCENAKEKTGYLTADNTIDNLEIPLIFNEEGLDDVEKTLHFFSVDAAKNHETLNKLTFKVDTKVPELITADHEVLSEIYEVSGSEEVLSLITSNFEFTEPVTCSKITFGLVNNSNPDSIDGVSGADIKSRVKIENGQTIHYIQTQIGRDPASGEYTLITGSYRYEFICHDDYGNGLEDEVLVDINQDNRITNIHPFLERFDTTEIQMSFNINKQATCYYSNEFSTFDNMKTKYDADAQGDKADFNARKYTGMFTASADGKTQTKTLQIANTNSKLWSGVYEFNIACQDIDNDIIEPEKRIIFGVDLIPPITDVQKIGEQGAPFDFTKKYDLVQLNFSCRDPSFFIENNNLETVDFVYGTTDLRLGCRELVVLLDGTRITSSENPVTEINYLMPQTSEDYDPQNFEFEYYSFDGEEQTYDGQDISRNKEDNKFNTLTIDNVPPEVQIKLEKLEGTTYTEILPGEIVGFGNYRTTITIAEDVNDGDLLSERLNMKLESQADNIVNAEPVIRTTSNSEQKIYYWKLYSSSNRDLRDLDETLTITFDGKLNGQTLSVSEDYHFFTEKPATPKFYPMFSAKTTDYKVGESGKTYQDYQDKNYPYIYYANKISLADGTTVQDVYVISDSTPFISGGSSEKGEIEIRFAKMQTNGEGEWESTGTLIKDTYQQLEGAKDFLDDTYSLKYSANELDTQVIFSEDYSYDSNIYKNGNFINFGNLVTNLQPNPYPNTRTDYENYGKFYSINDLTQDPRNLNVNTEYGINLIQELQKQISQGIKIYSFDKEFQNGWFGFEFEGANILDEPTELYSNTGVDSNKYLFVGILKSHQRESETYEVKVFVDPESPKLVSAIPSSAGINDNLEIKAGTINSKRPISFEFRERNVGSGLKNDSIKLTVYDVINDNLITLNKNSQGLKIDYPDDEPGYKHYNITYLPQNGWVNGEYEVTLFLTDNAGNELQILQEQTLSNFSDVTLKFTVDNRVPTEPLFTVAGTTEENVDSDGRQHTKELINKFELDYTIKELATVDEPEVLEELDIKLHKVNSSNPEDETDNKDLTCDLKKDSNGDNIKNVFECKYLQSGNEAPWQEGIYNLYANSSKLFAPNEVGGNPVVGPHTNPPHVIDRDGKPLTFIVDKTAPTFTLESDMKSIGADTEFIFRAILTNEEYDIKSKVTINGNEIDVDGTEINDGDDTIFTWEFIVPGDFDWGEEGEKIISVEISDYAGNKNPAQELTVSIDNTAPTLFVTNLIATPNPQILNLQAGTLAAAGQQINILSALVGSQDLTVEGVASTDSVEVCYYNEQYQSSPSESQCFGECQTSEIENCIQTGTGIFSITIQVTGLVDDTSQTGNEETLNNIKILANDEAGNQLDTNLELLLDIKAPPEPGVSVVN